MTADVLDLFAGPGGWDEGMAALDLAALGVEWDAAACATATAAHHQRLQADVVTLDPHQVCGDELYGMVASPPCQGFSTAGKGLGRLDGERILAAVGDLAAGRDVLPELRTQIKDHRSALALEPLRWALATEPAWLAWEQVPAVLPLWQACAAVLREDGYSVWCGNLQAEQYGVPQTRKRAILLASRGYQVSQPPPTHSRYHPRSPDKLDPGVLPWVSMAQALGWGMTRRPSMTVTGGGTSTGGAEPFGNAARQGIHRELEADRWQYNTSPMTNATRRNPDQPAPTLSVGHQPPHWQPASGEATTVRVSITEAAVLQSFRSDYPWQGAVTHQYRQIGDAVPPLLALHVVAAATGLALPDYLERAS